MSAICCLNWKLDMSCCRYCSQCWPAEATIRPTAKATITATATVTARTLPILFLPILPIPIFWSTNGQEIFTLWCSVLSFASVAIVLRLFVMFVHTSRWGPRQVCQQAAIPYRVSQVLVIFTSPTSVCSIGQRRLLAERSARSPTSV